MRASDRARAAVGAALVTGSLAVATCSAVLAQTRQDNCFWLLANGRGAELVCEHPAWLTEAERTDLRKLTRDVLQDVRCTVSVRIARKLVDDALELTDHVFQAPPQPVACDIDTSGGPMRITATFAPRVVIAGGKATEATPGLAAVKGVNAYLAWPVVQYVNFAPSIRNEMLRMINAYLERISPGAVARR